MKQKQRTTRGIRFSDRQWKLIESYADQVDMSCSEAVRMIVDKFFGVKEGEA